MGSIKNSYGPNLAIAPAPAGQFGGRLISGLKAVVDEDRGLGSNVAVDWPDLTIMGTPEEYFEGDHSRTSVTFKIPYWRRGLLMASLLGFPLQTSSGYKRHLPEVYRNWQWSISDDVFNPVGPVKGPVSGLTPVQYCTKAVAKGHGLPADWNTQNVAKLGNDYYPDPQFQWAIVEAVFETLAYDAFLLSEITVTPDRPAEMQRYVIKTKDSDGRYLQYAIGDFVLESVPGAGLAGGYDELGRSDLNFWEGFESIRYEWLDVLPGMTNQVRNVGLQGQCNSVTFDTYPPQTIFLRKATEVPKRDQFGRRIYNYVFDMLHIPTGVNKALKPGSRSNLPADYKNVISKKFAGQVPYPPTDLTVIFQT